MTYNTPIDVYERLKEHYNEAQKLGYEVIGCFLQGSYNYEKNFGDITDDKSDVDSKCLVLPSFKDFCLGRKPVSFTHEMKNGEHLDIKDFRLYLNMFKKQNINMVEILFTNYYIWNPKYMNICYRMFSNREKIARYDVKAALNCMVGMAFEKQKALCHPYPTLKEKIEKYGFDGKQLSHVYRLNEFIDKYIAGESYEKCLKTDMGEFLRQLKRNEIFSLELAKTNMDRLTQEMKQKKDLYLETHEVKKDEYVDKLFEELAVEAMEINFTSYLRDKNK